MPHVYPKHNLAAVAACPHFGGALKKLLLFVVFLPMLLVTRAQSQPPHIRMFVPDSARTNDTVLIYGNHFDSVNAVSFGGVSAKSFFIFSDSLLWAVVGNGASGQVKVSSANGGVDSLAGFIFITSSPVLPPVINSFSPDSGTTGTVVTLRGVHFLTTTSVQFGGVSASGVAILSDSVIRAVVGAGATGTIKVINKAGQGVSASQFIFIAPPPPVAPHISSFFPDSARTNDTVRIVGTHLDSVNSVSFGGVTARSFTIVSDSLIRAVVGTGASGYVRVSSAHGTDSLAGFIFITSSPVLPPVINSFSPDSGTTGTVVTLRGVHFLTTTSVQFGGVSASGVAILSDSVIRAVVGAGATGTIKVINQAGQGVSASQFIFIAPPPVTPHISSFFPDSARTNDTVRIVGIHLDSVNAVSFGGVTARSFTIVSDSLIWAVVGNGATGQVKVSSPAGTDSLGGFIFAPALPTAAPSISSFTPTSGTAGTVVTIHGAHFRGTTLVRFGGTSAASFSVLSDSVVTAVVGNGSSGPIKMTNARGTGVSAGSFNYRHGHSSLTVYPNPVSGGTMTVQVPETTTQSKFLLTDASGHTVLAIPVGAGVKQMVIPVSRLNKGVYKLVWSDGQSTASQTILIIQ